MSEPFHLRLKYLREKQNLTAVEMARRISVPQSTYSDWESGKGLKLPPFQEISRVLAISVTELLTGEKPDIASALEKIRKIEEDLREMRTNLGSVS